MKSDFLTRFDALAASVLEEGKTLGQCIPEYRQFLEYVAGYFERRGIEHPVIVEIGICDNCQERFYEGLLGAEHIAIDINPNARGNPEIIGDSRAPETIEKLLTKLAGRPIDLLFIDGDHTYEYAKFEYENYGPLTRHIIAFHDLVCTEKGIGVEVHRLWQEICAMEKKYCLASFYRHNDSLTIWPGHEMGIGVIVKGGGE
jgi:hypothetical protein